MSCKIRVVGASTYIPNEEQKPELTDSSYDSSSDSSTDNTEIHPTQVVSQDTMMRGTQRRVRRG